MSSYYDILNVSKSSSNFEIRQAYVQLIKQIKQKKSNYTIDYVNKIYDTLKNPLSRFKYDSELSLSEQKYTEPINYDKLDIYTFNETNNYTNISNIPDSNIYFKDFNPESKMNKSINDLLNERSKDENDFKIYFDNQESTQKYQQEIVSPPSSPEIITHTKLEFTQLKYLPKAEQTNINESIYNEINEQMKEAIKNQNIEEYIKLRNEEKRILTKELK